MEKYYNSNYAVASTGKDVRQKQACFFARLSKIALVVILILQSGVEGRAKKHACFWRTSFPVDATA